MSDRSAWIRFPSETAFRRAARSAGLPPEFLGPARGPGNAGGAGGPVCCLTRWHDGTLSGCAPYFPRSAEIGLWVRIGLRRRGIGAALLDRASDRAARDHPLVYARVLTRGNGAAAMSRLLARAGFALWAENDAHALWARPRR